MSEEFENATPNLFRRAAGGYCRGADLRAGRADLELCSQRPRVQQKTELDEATQQNKQLAAKLRETDARSMWLRGTRQVARFDQKQMDARAQEIIRREQAVEATRRNWPPPRSKPRSRSAPFPVLSPT